MGPWKGASDSESGKGISNEKIGLQYASKDKAGTLSVPAWLPRGSMVIDIYYYAGKVAFAELSLEEQKLLFSYAAEYVTKRE